MSELLDHNKQLRVNNAFLLGKVMMNEVLYEQIDALEKKLVASRRENDRLKKENDKLKKEAKKDQLGDETAETTAEGETNDQVATI